MRQRRFRKKFDCPDMQAGGFLFFPIYPLMAPKVF